MQILTYIIQIIVALAIVAFILFLFSGWIFVPYIWIPLTRKSREKKWKEDIENPQWEEISLRLNCPVPPSLKSFYKNKKAWKSLNRVKIRKKGEGDHWFLLSLLPATVNNILKFEGLPEKSFEIGTDGSEGIFFVVLEPKIKKRCPVFFYYMDTPISSANPVKVSDSLESFSKWPWKKWDGVFK